MKFNNDNILISTLEQNGQLLLTITLNGQQKWEVTPFIKQYMAKYKNQSGQISVPEISVENDLGNYHLKIVFGNLIRENFQKEQIYYNDAYLLIRRK